MIKKEISFQEKYFQELSIAEQKISSLFLDASPQEFYEICNYAMSGGGKRLRYILLVFVSKYFQKKTSNKIIKAGLAFELAHTFSLIHDDIMDNANKRRGCDSVYKRNGLNMAILAGDSLFSYAYLLLIESCSPQNLKEVLLVFTREAIATAEGQASDLIFEKKIDISISQYEEMIYKKTALLFKVSCQIAAILSQGTQKEIATFSEFGKKIGMAYQIQDDLLDIRQKTNNPEKPIFLDIIKRKKTFLFISALNNSNKAIKSYLLSFASKKGDASPAEVMKIVKIYKDLKIELIAESRLRTLLSDAKRNLNGLRESEAKKFLLQLVDSIEMRQK